MIISIGSDHRGFRLKEELIKELNSRNFTVIDFGTDSDSSVDYPDYAERVAVSVVSGKADFGIAICGSGIGVSIAANKVSGARAVNATNENMAEMSRKHNDARIICFGADFINKETALKYFDIFITTEFEGGERHERRINKLNNIK